MEFKTGQGPDFICIGMIKAGTGWLYDQLRLHPDFWMPPVKEIRYLSSEPVKMAMVERFARRIQASPERRGRRRSLDSLSEPDLAFLREAEGYSGVPRDFQRYASLFRYKGELLSGDISPAYSRLTEDVVQQLAAALPSVKVVFLLRDPVARLWSGLSMLQRQGRFDASILEDPDKFRSYLHGSQGEDFRWFPSRIVQLWRRAAPNLEFRHFFFDDIQRQPEFSRQEILLYLRADPQKSSGALPANYNRKASKPKLLLTEPIREVLIQHFADEIRACVELFGGHAKQWMEEYGLGDAGL